MAFALSLFAFASGKAVGGQTPSDIATSAVVKKLLAKGPSAKPRIAVRPIAQPPSRKPEPTGAEIPVSFVGRPVSEVKKILGPPKMAGKRGGKLLLLYDGRKITSADGTTVDGDTGR